MVIHNRTGTEHPLYIHTIKSVTRERGLCPERRQDFLENALFLLDLNIKFLNAFCSESEVIGAKLYESGEDGRNISRVWWEELVQPPSGSESS
jgi:hypothetical protein